MHGHLEPESLQQPHLEPDCRRNRQCVRADPSTGCHGSASCVYATGALMPALAGTISVSHGVLLPKVWQEFCRCQGASLTGFPQGRAVSRAGRMVTWSPLVTRVPTFQRVFRSRWRWVRWRRGAALVRRSVTQAVSQTHRACRVMEWGQGNGIGLVRAMEWGAGQWNGRQGSFANTSSEERGQGNGMD